MDAGNIRGGEEQARARSVVSDSATPWTAARQVPLSVGFSWQEDCSGLPSPPAGDLPDPGIEPASPALADGFLTAKPPGVRTSEIWSWVIPPG